MALLGSIIWIVIGIVYILYQLYKEEREDFKVGIVVFFAIFLIAAPICIGNYLTEESKDEIIQALGFFMVEGTLTAIVVGLFLWMYLPCLRVRKRTKKLLKHLGLSNHNELSDKYLRLHEATCYIEAKCYDTEPLYVDYLTLYGTDVQKRRLIELMTVKSENINNIMNYYNKEKALPLNFFYYGVLGNCYIRDDEDEQKTRLCQILDVKYFSTYDVMWDYHLTLDILEKEGLIQFPEELHSPDYRKYREYIQTQAPR